MISVIIPALNDEHTIADVVKFCTRQPMVKEVIVVDARSIDNTVSVSEAAGARVVMSYEPGKGRAIKEGIETATNPILLFLDAKINPYPSASLRSMVAPLLKNECDFVKGYTSQAPGKITELVVRPLLKVFFPALANIHHPISGMIAARKPVLEKLDIFNDYGADIGILIDMEHVHARIREVNIGSVNEFSVPGHHVATITNDVANAIVSKAKQYHSPAVNVKELGAISIISRTMQNVLISEMRQVKKMVVFDMDNTLLLGRFIDRCAERFGFTDQLKKLREANEEPAVLTKRIARLLKGCSLADMLKVAGSIPVIDDASRVVHHLKQEGYITGIISDSYQFVVDFVKSKIGAEFAVGNQLEFYNGRATGEVTIPSLFYYHGNSKCNHGLCKTNALMHLGDKYGVSLSNCMVVGDSENDLCMVENAGLGVAFCTTHTGLRKVADRIIEKPSFGELIELRS
jgi:glucosyl-3-phosphoglycerate synthase